MIARPAKCLLRNVHPLFSSFQDPSQKSRFRNLLAAIENTKCDVKDSISPVYRPSPSRNLRGSSGTCEAGDRWRRPLGTSRRSKGSRSSCQRDEDGWSASERARERSGTAPCTASEGKSPDQTCPGMWTVRDGYVVRVVRVLQRNHHQVDEEDNDHKREAFDALVEPVSRPRRSFSLSKATCQREDSCSSCKQQWFSLSRLGHSTEATLERYRRQSAS